jgi:hypothetical protein
VLQSSVCHNSLDVYLSDSRFQVPRQAHRVRLISLPRAALKLRTRPLVHLYLVFAAKQFEKMVQCSIHADRQMKAVSLGAPFRSMATLSRGSVKDCSGRPVGTKTRP